MTKQVRNKIYDGKLSTGNKVRVIDEQFKENPIIWGRDLFIAFMNNDLVHVTDNLNFPVFIHFFDKKQIRKIR